MKRFLALFIPVCFLSLTLFGCASDTTNDTSKPGANGSVIDPQDDMTTGDDLLQDGKDTIDDMVDDGRDAIDDVVDGTEDIVDPDYNSTTQNNSAGTSNTVQTPNNTTNPNNTTTTK